MILVACLSLRVSRYFIFSKIYANCNRAALLDKNLLPRVNLGRRNRDVYTYDETKARVLTSERI